MMNHWAKDMNLWDETAHIKVYPIRVKVQRYLDRRDNEYVSSYLLGLYMMILSPALPS
jgi:hypothetical protein